MVEKIYDHPEIYRIDVDLPENPLKYLNCYVIKVGEESLVIDTGFRRSECFSALKSGLDELEVNMDKAILFLTHLHSDHTGLTNEIITEGTKVMMGEVDYQWLLRELGRKDSGLRPIEQLFYREGLPLELIEAQRKGNPAWKYALQKIFPARQMKEEEVFCLGPYHFRCIWTPGHTPGHMCLYLEEEEILFSGDHILFDITSNIDVWMDVKDSLGDYLDSLKKMKDLEIRLCLPGHRKNDKDVYERIEELEEHHRFRLNQVLTIIKNEPGLTAYEIGGRMTWSMRGKNWEEFPIQQKWFALGETITHLDYLRLRGKIFRREGEIRYYDPL